MAENKRYYWLKLKSDFFQRDEIDFLMSRPNGSDYVVLYLMLCSQTLNNGGILATNVGDVLVKYDANKIARDTKYFNVDTIMVAFNLYKSLGLIYEDVNGTITISDYENYVGSSATDDHTKMLNADRQRRYRERKKLTTGNGSDNNVTVTLPRNVDIEIDKEIDIEIDKDIYVSKETDNTYVLSSKKKRFTKPTLEEVQAYIQENNYNVDSQRFIDYYESNGWKVGKNSMKDWKAAVRTWARNDKNKPMHTFQGLPDLKSNTPAKMLTPEEIEEENNKHYDF